MPITSCCVCCKPHWAETSLLLRLPDLRPRAPEVVDGLLAGDSHAAGCRRRATKEPAAFVPLWLYCTDTLALGLRAASAARDTSRRRRHRTAGDRHLRLMREGDLHGLVDGDRAVDRTYHRRMGRERRGNELGLYDRRQLRRRRSRLRLGGRQEFVPAPACEGCPQARSGKGECDQKTCSAAQCVRFMLLPYSTRSP